MTTHPNATPPAPQPNAATPTDPAALIIDNLVKDFKPTKDYARKHPDALTPQGLKRAVNHLCLEIDRGRVTVLLGANGAGKTTTLACAQGLLKPDAGSVTLLGHQAWGADPELRARVGIMLQDGGLPPSARPIPLLKHIASMYADPLNVEELANRLGIDTFNGTTIRRLSGGQKQRVALAAAIIGRPEILFLDEPTAGLDPQSRSVVFDIIQEQRDAGVAVVLTTHLLDDAQRIADYVYMIEEGTVVLAGTMDHILKAGKDGDRTLTFTSPSGITIDTIWPTGNSPLHLTEGPECHYQLTGPLTPQHLADLTTYWATHNLMPGELSLANRSLEDIFLEHSGKHIR
ncbi:ABC transporter ATP-binding protein [Rothia nasimurium]|uniref:ABC transporter ATP-binding protein n=3 Tax=Rothia nasimurium TaxID=85336 RepID=UPI001F3ADAC4|nr:ABC transporter ATP-binding protein [Rothia nasimurium]